MNRRKLSNYILYNQRWKKVAAAATQRVLIFHSCAISKKFHTVFQSFLPFLCNFWRFCSFLHKFKHFCTYLGVNFSGSNFCQCYFVSFSIPGLITWLYPFGWLCTISKCQSDCLKGGVWGGRGGMIVNRRVGKDQKSKLWQRYSPFVTLVSPLGPSRSLQIIFTSRYWVRINIRPSCNLIICFSTQTVHIA